MRERIELVLAELERLADDAHNLKDGLRCYWLIKAAHQSLHRVSSLLIRFERNTEAPKTFSPEAS